MSGPIQIPQSCPIGTWRGISETAEKLTTSSGTNAPLWPFPLRYQDTQNTNGHETQNQCPNFTSCVILGESLNPSSLRYFICEMQVVKTILVRRSGMAGCSHYPFLPSFRTF